MSKILACLVLACAVSCAADAPDTKPQLWPLWDGGESVSDYAKRTNLWPTKTLDLGNGVNLELVLIPAGKFVMGTPEPDKPKSTVVVGQAFLGVGSTGMLAMILFVVVRSVRSRQRPQFSLLGLLGFVFSASIALYGGMDWWRIAGEWRQHAAAIGHPSERPAHEVTLTTPFYMSKFETTQEQYAQMMGANPSHFTRASLPVETVSWDDAQEFCRKAIETTRAIVRLPKETEWEFSCRAGTTTAYCTGDGESDLRRAAWYSANSGGTTHPVGQKAPNAFGLYDMHGNVWEWCQDRLNQREARAHPQGPQYDQSCILRGGSWFFIAEYCRSARPDWLSPDARGWYFGFRVVVEAPPRTP